MIIGRLRRSRRGWKVAIARYWDGGSQYREEGDGDDDGLDLHHGFENNEVAKYRHRIGSRE